ncbi:MAG: T9SS type A sorting domain-containing protein [Bacteroidota bacterium]
MKRSLLVAVFSLWMVCGAQYVTIPDTNFVHYLNSFGYSQCMVGNQMDTTCTEIIRQKRIEIDAASQWWRDSVSIEGIQYFDSLEVLDWRVGNLIYFSELPPRLDTLYCGGNPLLKRLPPLPLKLRALNCFGHSLDSLPALPSSLEYLNCRAGHLTFLPSLPSSLRRLECQNNELNTLPPYPDSIVAVNCGYNLITVLPEFPDSLGSFFIPGNPGLQCLPTIKKLVTFNFTNTGIVCVPNYGSVTNSFPDINSLPLCNSLNPNPCLTTDVSEISNQQSAIRISPNPATTSVTLQLEQTPSSSTTFQLFDVTGRMILQKSLTETTNRVELSGVSKGMYLYNVVSDKERLGAGKVVVE